MADTLWAMAILWSFFILILHLLGFPVEALWIPVRNISLSLAFLFFYNLIMKRYGLTLGINPVTVGCLSIFGVHGFCAMNFLIFLL